MSITSGAGSSSLSSPISPDQCAVWAESEKQARCFISLGAFCYAETMVKGLSLIISDYWQILCTQSCTKS